MPGSGRLFVFLSFKITFPAKRFVNILFPQEDLLFILQDAVRIMCKVPAAHADRMQLRDVFGGCDQCRHRSEWIPQVIHVQSGHQDADAVVGHDIADFGDRRIEKLRFIDANHIHILDQQQDLGCGVYRCGGNCMGIVRDNLDRAVPCIDHRFKDLDFLPGDPCTVQSPDQLFRFPGEHRTADHLDPPGTRRNVFFKKHGSLQKS